MIDPVNTSLKLIQYADGGFHLDVRDSHDHERPPIRTIPKYMERQQVAEEV